ncbi:hypothetical protein D3C72_1977400 [compost metagenome]
MKPSSRAISLVTPRARKKSCLLRLATPIGSAPAAKIMSIAAVPTPPAADCTSTRSPAFREPTWCSMW